MASSECFATCYCRVGVRDCDGLGWTEGGVGGLYHYVLKISPRIFLLYRALIVSLYTIWVAGE